MSTLSLCKKKKKSAVLDRLIIGKERRKGEERKRGGREGRGRRKSRKEQGRGDGRKRQTRRKGRKEEGEGGKEVGTYWAKQMNSSVHISVSGMGHKRIKNRNSLLRTGL